MAAQLEDPDADQSVTEKALAKRELSLARREVEQLGGWRAFKNGKFLFPLICKSFKSCYDNADAAQLRAAHPGLTDAQITTRLITSAARRAAFYGVATGAVISADEIVALFTGGEGVVGLPVNLAIAVTAICAEAICLVRVHLQLIADLARLLDSPLNADDPEEILLILACAFGGGGIEAAGKFGMKIGQAASSVLLQTIIGKDAQSFAARIGAKFLRRSIFKYALPLVSMALGGGWNFAATKAVGKTALAHMARRAAEKPAIF